jgi:hypothetical protein
MESTKQSHPSPIDADALPDTMVEPLAEQEVGDEDFDLGEVRRADHEGSLQSGEPVPPASAQPDSRQDSEQQDSEQQDSRQHNTTQPVGGGDDATGDETGIRTDNGL